MWRESTKTRTPLAYFFWLRAWTWAKVKRPFAATPIASLATVRILDDGQKVSTTSTLLGHHSVVATEPENIAPREMEKLDETSQDVRIKRHLIRKLMVVQRLKSALWFSIGKIVDEESLRLNVNATPQFIGALTEMVWTQIGTDAFDRLSLNS